MATISISGGQSDGLATNLSLQYRDHGLSENGQHKFFDADYLKELINKNPEPILKLINAIWEQTEKVIDSALSKKEKSPKTESIFIKANNQIINLKLSDILWIEAYGDYINFFTEKAKYLVHSTMKGIESKLPDDQFTRIHRSFIIRTDKIDLIDESIIQIGKKLIPIGESYHNTLMSRLNLL
jgi:DNA-binding LytR/AlgR family response regulator